MNNDENKKVVENAPLTPNAPVEEPKEETVKPVETVEPPKEPVEPASPSTPAEPVQVVAAPTPTVPVQEPVQTPTETKPEEPKKEETKEDKKKSKQVKVKKRRYFLSVFFNLLLLLIIVGLVYVMNLQDDIKKHQKGVTDLETLDIPEEKKDKLYDSKKVIDNIEPKVSESVINYLLQDKYTKYLDYINSLNNETKLYLADLFNNNSITLDSLKFNLKSLFGKDIDIEGKNFYYNGKLLYEFNSNTVMFTSKISLGSIDYKPFGINGELMILEYDDPVGTKDEFSITVYSAFLIRNGNKESIRNKKNTLAFDKSLSINQIKDNILTYYSDHKEEFDKITYKFIKFNNKNCLTEVTIE